MESEVPKIDWYCFRRVHGSSKANVQPGIASFKFNDGTTLDVVISPGILNDKKNILVAIDSARSNFFKSLNDFLQIEDYSISVQTSSENAALYLALAEQYAGTHSNHEKCGKGWKEQNAEFYQAIIAIAPRLAQELEQRILKEKFY